MSFIIVREYQNATSAQLDLMTLKGQGIDARLHGENAANIKPSLAIYDSIKLLVPEHQAAQAASLLGEMFMEKDAERCPKCGSPESCLASPLGFYIMVFFMLLSMTLLKPGKKLRCKECGTVWKAGDV